MRLNLRVAGVIAVVLSAISCSGASDGLTAERSIGHSAARIAIAPVFSTSAIQAYGTLASIGVAVTTVHITVFDLSGTAVLDTMVAFPVGNDILSVDLALQIQGNEQQFNVTVELLDASGTVQFSGTQRVTARDVSLSPEPAATITLQFVGPGFSVKTVAVSPADATVLPGATQQLIATATNQTGAPVSDLNVTWTLSDTTIAKITQTGNITATVTARGPRGAVTITATALAGAIGTAKLTVLPQAARLAVISGNGQTGVALQNLATPFVVEVQATDGGKIAGTLVNFRAVTAGGEVATAIAATDATGRASTTMKLGRNAGNYSFEATSGSLAPVTVGVTATTPPVGPPTQLIPLTPLPTSFKVGVMSTQRFTAQLADANGYYVLQSGVPITATMVVSPGGATTSGTTVSDALGVITFSIPAFNTVGSVLITLTSPVIPNLPYGTFPITP
jgi:hypothetical protein